MDPLGYGRTATVHRVADGLVCKAPWSLMDEQLRAEIDNAFVVEKRILERLGVHPRIVHFHGPYKIEAMKEDLLLAEANRGNLQSYIDSDDYFNTDKSLRQKWSLQIAEAVSYVHENGITHSNLSTANVLVHQAGQNIDLILADFGGSNCSDLGLSGHLLPDDPFFDPFVTNFESPKLDIFSLGVLLYIVNTGHWPFHTRPAPSDDERFAYEDFAHSQLEQNKFPDLTNVLFGNVIAGCCIERRFETAHEVVVALEAELEHNSPQ